MESVAMADTIPFTQIIHLTDVLAPLYAELKNQNQLESAITALRNDCITMLSVADKRGRSLSSQELRSCLSLDYALTTGKGLSEHLEELRKTGGPEAVQHFIEEARERFLQQLKKSGSDRPRQPACIICPRPRHGFIPFFYHVYQIGP